MKRTRVFSLAESFKIPILVLGGTMLYLILIPLDLTVVSLIVILITIALGSMQLLIDSYEQLRRRQFALDYIAIIAIIVALVTKEYLVGAILALMIASGRTLEEYGATQAKKSLTALVDRIPKEVYLWTGQEIGDKVTIESVNVGQFIFIRKGEVIPLDGKLISANALIDESSLTGEAIPVHKLKEDYLRSGTINVGDTMIIQVTREEKNSTYSKIIQLVKKAEKEKAPLVRLADQYSTIFTIVTFVIAAFAFLYTQSIHSILSVLVVATPCPLILATPIALMGGVNAAAKRRIIIKRLASLEMLHRVTAIVFDKTGTITLGKPVVTNVKIFDHITDETTILSITEAIERNSLHPLAKALVKYAQEHNAHRLHAQEVKEVIGEGIWGTIDDKRYTLASVENATNSDIAISLSHDNKILAVFSLEDRIKEDSQTIIKKLTGLGIQISIFTGDKIEIADRVAKKLGSHITVVAECSPEDKMKGIEHLKKIKKTTAMVGDGINDAPALALADVGMVFSNEEHTAASEAADIVFLGGDFSLVLSSFEIARKTIAIATQSIVWGIGLSIIAMIFAALGFIPPIIGAILQEAIDVAVILNALRASK